MEGFLADLPPTLEQRRRILEPLTERQLAQSFRQVRLDRHDHVIAKHSKTAYPLPWHAVGVMKRLAEEPTAHDRRPMFIAVLSNAVSEYWSHPIRNSRGLPPMARAAYATPMFLVVTGWQDRRAAPAPGAPATVRNLVALTEHPDKHLPQSPIPSPSGLLGPQVQGSRPPIREPSTCRTSVRLDDPSRNRYLMAAPRTSGCRGHTAWDTPDARCGWPFSSPRRIPHTSSGTGRTRFASAGRQLPPWTLAMLKGVRNPA